MLTFTPDNSMSYYSCGWCEISAQDPVPAYDADGTPILTEDGVQVMVNDEPTASAELGQHVSDAHAGQPLPPP